MTGAHKSRHVGFACLALLLSVSMCVSSARAGNLRRAPRTEAPPETTATQPVAAVQDSPAAHPPATRALIIGPSTPTTLVPGPGLDARPGVGVARPLAAPPPGPAEPLPTEPASVAITSVPLLASPSRIDGASVPTVVGPPASPPPTLAARPTVVGTGVTASRPLSIRPGGADSAPATALTGVASSGTSQVTGASVGTSAGVFRSAPPVGQVSMARPGEPSAAPGPLPAMSRPAGGPGGAAATPDARAAVAPPVSAASGSVTVSPDQAAALALESSLDLAINAADIRQAVAQLRKSFGLDDFRLSASYTYGRRGPVATISFPGPGGQAQSIKAGSPEINVAQLQLTKPLYSRSISRSQDVAAKGLETRKLSRSVVERALDLSARQAAYGVLRAAQLADVAAQRATAVAAHLEQSKRLMEAGVVPRFEVVQAETELARAQGEVIAARTAVENAKAALKRVLTLPQETQLEVVPGTPPTVPPGDQAALVARAWESRPEIHAAQAAIALAEANVRLASASSDLTVSLAGGLTKQPASFASEDLTWQVAVSAELPIFDGNLEKNEVRAARAQLEAARLELEKLKQQIALEVAQDWLAVGEATERLRVAQQGVVEAQEQLRISKVRYENGIALGIEVLDAETALAAARAEVANSEYGLQMAITQLRSDTGLWSGSEGGE